MSMSTDDLEDPFDLLREEEAAEGGRVAVDTLVERRDLGPESYTLVAAGSPMPPHLAHLPSRPAQPEPDASTSGSGDDQSKADTRATKPRPSKTNTKTNTKPDATPEQPQEAATADESRSW